MSDGWGPQTQQAPSALLTQLLSSLSDHLSAYCINSITCSEWQRLNFVTVMHSSVFFRFLGVQVMGIDPWTGDMHPLLFAVEGKPCIVSLYFGGRRFTFCSVVSSDTSFKLLIRRRTDVPHCENLFNSKQCHTLIPASVRCNRFHEIYSVKSMENYQVVATYQMSDFNAKMHPIQFRLRLCPGRIPLNRKLRALPGCLSGFKGASWAGWKGKKE